MRKLHQFYYTNYGRGYRIEASSIPDLESSGSVVSAIQASAGIWEGNLSGEGTETVSFSERTGRFMSARTVPCRQPGDSRPGFWSHVILPEKDGSDGFAACLSWPEECWETEVCLGESLEDVSLPEKEYDLQEICRKYGLGRERLAQLILLAAKSASGGGGQARLLCTEGSADACIRSAREMMMLIYHLLPDALRCRAGYQVPAEKTGSAVCFCFCRAGSRQTGFSLDPKAQAEADPDALAQEMGLRLAELFAADPGQYQEVIRFICGSRTEDFETILWNYFRQMEKRELARFPQALLSGNAARLLQAAEQDAGLSAFTENWFAAVKMDAADTRFAGFTELSLQEAQMLKDRDEKAYRRCILRCRSLLRDLSHDEDTFQKNLGIISGQYPAIAQDISHGPGAQEPEERREESTAEAGKRRQKTKRGSGKNKGIVEDDYSQKTVAFSFLFAGCYLALVMSLCGLFEELARQQQNPAIFAGGIAAVIAGCFLLMLLNAVTGLLHRDHHISVNGIFMAGAVLAVIAAVAAIAGPAAAAAVSGVGTVIFGAFLAFR